MAQRSSLLFAVTSIVALAATECRSGTFNPTPISASLPPTAIDVVEASATPFPSAVRAAATDSKILEPTATALPQVLAGRAFPSIVFSTQSHQVVLFGGLKSWYTPLLDTWTWDPARDQWSAMAPAESPEGWGIAVYDDRDDQVIVYVGSARDASDAGLVDHVRPVGETWAYDVGTDTWSNLDAVDTPVGFLAASLAYDSESDQVILFGGASLMEGRNGAVPMANATWAYNPTDNVWTSQNPSTRPPARALAAMTYDASVDRVILFGGHQEPFTTPFSGDLQGGASLADTWEYDFNADSWEQIPTVESPAARRCGSIVYDSYERRSILVGGSDGLDCSGSLQDSWAFDAGAATWTRLGEAPQLTFQGMAYIPGDHEIVAFVGGTAWIYFKPVFWVFDLTTYRWSEARLGD